MNRVTVLISCLLAILLGLATTSVVWAVEAVDVKADIKVLDLTPVVETYAGEGDRIQISTAPGLDGIVRRIEVRSRQQGTPPGWFVFALANNSDRQIDRYLVVPHFRMAGSGLLKPDLGAQRVFAISTSQGFAPERIPDSEADVFRVTLDPGNVVTFVGEQSHRSLPGLTLWEPAAYKDYVNSYTFFRGIVLGIAGLLALFLVILFVVKGAAMFPAAALLAWSVLAYLAIDFGFMGRLFDIPTASEPIWRAVAEVVFSASILILLFTYLTLHRWHVRYLHATGIWLVFLIVVLGIAFYDPSLGAGIARLSMVVTSVAGLAVILYLAYTGFDRAIMLIPTWFLLLLWLLASGSAVSGFLNNDLVQPALSGGLVLLVLLFCFTIMQHAFSGGILAQGIVSDSERRALAIVGSGDMVWDWDVPRDRIHTSRDAEKLLGLKRGALGGHARDWLDLLHPRDRDRFSAMLDAIIEQRRGRVNQDFRLRAEDGHYHWLKLRARPVVGTDGEVVRCVGTLLDITDQRTAESRLLHDAVHDNLTGLANRELMHDRLTAAMVRTQAEGAAKPAVLLVDIDNFRHINDSYGLSIGDSILLTVARRLSRLLKPQDSIARFYGDQFAIILISEQQPERIAVFADSVKKTLKVPIVFGERELTLSVSIGIAIHDVHAHKAAGDVVNDSELALYHAKRMGGDRIEPFRPSLRQQGRGRGSLDKDLVAALDRNEIEVVFQPIVDLNDRMIKGFEALARWNHPQRGNVPPSDFIPAAERTGLIVPMGIHVMEQAARQLNKWQQQLEGMDDLFMSVNVSSQQLLRHDLINDVKTILSRCNVNPGTLKLELTESLVMGNPEYASQVLDKLRELGAGLSLDDFGTGYSSLSYLQHFPFDTLKIDKSFVGHEQGVALIILRSIVQLAQDLHLNLVAEGIEDEEAAQQLVEMGCPMGQGYLFGKPLIPADAAALLHSQVEQHRQLKEEALTRRRQAEAEAAARKAEAERKHREEQRRKETEQLERKQAHAREIAAQSLSRPEPVQKPQPAPQTKADAEEVQVVKADAPTSLTERDEKPDNKAVDKAQAANQTDEQDDALENQLAASLAADLAAETIVHSQASEPKAAPDEADPHHADPDHADAAEAKQDQPSSQAMQDVGKDGKTVSNETGAQTPVERLAERMNGMLKRDGQTKTRSTQDKRAEDAPRTVTRSAASENGAQNEAVNKADAGIPDDVLAGLELDLENAVGAAAAQAVAQKSEDKPAPTASADQDKDAPKTTLLERMEATTSLFVKPFRKKAAAKDADGKDSKPQGQQTAQRPQAAQIPPPGPAVAAPQTPQYGTAAQSPAPHGGRPIPAGAMRPAARVHPGAHAAGPNAPHTQVPPRPDRPEVGHPMPPVQNPHGPNPHGQNLQGQNLQGQRPQMPMAAAVPKPAYSNAPTAPKQPVPQGPQLRAGGPQVPPQPTIANQPLPQPQNGPVIPVPVHGQRPAQTRPQMPPMPPQPEDLQPSQQRPEGRPEVREAKLVDAAPENRSGPVLPPVADDVARAAPALPNGASGQDHGEKHPEDRNQGEPATTPSSEVASREQDADLPFSMPDLSNIDQDIATAIQTAMMGSKKH